MRPHRRHRRDAGRAPWWPALDSTKVESSPRHQQQGSPDYGRHPRSSWAAATGTSRVWR